MADYDDKDEPLVRAALEKQLRGVTLSRLDEHAIRRWERAEAEKTRWKVYEAIPKKDWAAMSGRQQKVINEQASRYGFPIGSATINLPAFVVAFHDFLAKHHHRFQRAIEEEAVMVEATGVNSPAAERYRGFKADLAAMDVEARKKELLPRPDCRVGMLQIAARIRMATEHLDRRFGSDAREILEQALDEALIDIDTLFPGEEMAVIDAEG